MALLASKDKYRCVDFRVDLYVVILVDIGQNIIMFVKYNFLLKHSSLLTVRVYGDIIETRTIFAKDSKKRTH